MQLFLKAALLFISLNCMAQSKGIIIEFATGIGSPYSPFSHSWRGSVDKDGLYFKEYAAKGTYTIGKYWAIGTTIGWIRERYAQTGSIIRPTVPPPWGWESPAVPQREIAYIIPSLKLSLSFLRLDAGAIIYKANPANIKYDYYPFNGSHRLKPSLGLELGENGLYLYSRLFDAVPLYSGGGFEVGFAGRVSGQYEHKVFVTGLPFDVAGVGYRGEARIYKKTAISFGAILGGAGWDNKYLGNAYIFSIGLKSNVGN